MMQLMIHGRIQRGWGNGGPDPLLENHNRSRNPGHRNNGCPYTVNSEMFASVLFSRNFAYAKFREKKSSRNDEITLSIIVIGK